MNKATELMLKLQECAVLVAELNMLYMKKNDWQQHAQLTQLQEDVQAVCKMSRELQASQFQEL